MTKNKPLSKAPSPLSESKKSKPQSAHAHVTPYGVTDPQGHVMSRIQQAKPTLWAKIQNWD